MTFRVRGFGVPVRSVGGVVLIGNVGERLFGVPNRPTGIVKIRRCRCWIGRDPDLPSLVQLEGRSQVGGVKDDIRCARGCHRHRFRMGVRTEQIFQAVGSSGLLGNQQGRCAECKSGYPSNRSAQGFPQSASDLHFNSDGGHFQVDRSAFLKVCDFRVCLAEEWDCSQLSKYSLRLLPNGQMLTSKESSEAAEWAVSRQR